MYKVFSLLVHKVRYYFRENCSNFSKTTKIISYIYCQKNRDSSYRYNMYSLFFKLLYMFSIRMNTNRDIYNHLFKPLSLE